MQYHSPGQDTNIYLRPYLALHNLYDPYMLHLLNKVFQRDSIVKHLMANLAWEGDPYGIM